MKLIELQTKQKKIPKNPLLLFFLSLDERIDDIGSEKLKIFRLLGRFNKKNFDFEKYLDGAMRLLSNAEKAFIETRSDELIAWLLERFAFDSEMAFFKKDCAVYAFNHTISFPFRSKEVLSILIDIKSTLSADFGSIKKLILDSYKGITFVEGSFIYVSNQRDSVNKMHFELQKEDAFSEEEISVFQNTLPKIIEDFLKKPKTQFIVPSNRELLIKSFQWIIKDLTYDDVPHVFIDFSKQTVNSFQFSALICNMRKQTEVSLKEKLNHQDIHIESINSLAGKNYVKEGVVLTIEITIEFDLSIIDARKKSCNLIQNLIGPFRDVNGGLQEKIEQNFNLLCKEVKAPIDEIKHFFYGIIPQEKQATTPVSLLKKAYDSINQKSFNQEIDYFFKEDEDALCITIRTTHLEIEKEFRHLVLSKFPDTFMATTYTNGICNICCALQMSDQLEAEQFKTSALSFYLHWREKKELKQVLRLGCTTQFSSYDPRIGTEEESSCLLKMLFEGLTKIGKDGVPEKALAEKIEISKTGLVYRFHLRKSYWSNKTPLTAHDFAYSWETSLRPDFLSPLSYLFYPIKNAKLVKEGKLPSSKLGIKAIDDLTLEIELQYPTPNFLELCAHSAFSPVCKSLDISNSSWPKSLGESYICNGPFVMDMISRKEVILKKNFIFWEKNQIKLEKIIIISNLTKNELPELFQNKKLDAVLFPFCKHRLFESIDYQKSQHKKSITEVRYLGFNCLEFPFTNRKMRQAFSLAIQRESLALRFSNQAAPHYAAYSPEFSQLRLDLENEENYALARKLFFEALNELKLGPEIFNNEAVYATSFSNGIEKIIAKQINDVFGINLTPVVVNSQQFFLMLRKRKLNLYIYSWINRIQDPSYFLDTFSSEVNIINYSNWNSEHINDLSQLIRETACLETRKKFHYQAEKILHQEKPVVPLLSTSIGSQIQPNVHDIFISDSLAFDVRYCYKE